MNIFISYRHGDGATVTAKLLHDRLADHFDASAVFLDNSELAVGDQFPDELATKLESCDVFLALLDPHWVATMPRLQEPADWVRREIEIALRRRRDQRIRVIPVLLSTTMPDAASLPPTVAPITSLIAARLHGDSLDDDIASLVQRLKGGGLTTLLLLQKAARRSALRLAAVLLLLFSASVMALFDALNVDTGLAAFTMALADMIDDRAPSSQLAIVAIDQATERSLRKTFDKTWRHEHAQLIRRLNDAGARVVAFDIYLEAASEHDQELVAAAEAAQQRGTAVVFGSASRSAASVLPATAVEHGLLCVGTELDWARLAALVVLRPLPPAPAAPASAPKWQYLASLGARAVAPRSTIRYVDLENRQVIVEPRDGEPFRLPFSRTETVPHQQTCAALATGDVVAQGIIRFTRLDLLREPVRRHRYADLLVADTAELATKFRGKIVLVGSELDPEDHRWVYRGLRSEQRYGYEIQADVINTLLQGITIRSLSPLPQLLVMLAMGALGLAGRFWGPLRRPWRSRLYAGAVPVAYLALSIWLCAEADWLLNSAYDLAAFFFAVWVAGRILRGMGLLNRGRA